MHLKICIIVTVILFTNIFIEVHICFFGRSDSFADFSQFNPAAASSSNSASTNNDLLDVFGSNSVSSANMGNPNMASMSMPGMNQTMMGVNMNMGIPNQVGVVKGKNLY